MPLIQLIDLGSVIKEAYEDQPLTLLGNTESHGLAAGTATLTLTNTYRFELTGTATFSFNLTLANGTVLGQMVRIVVTGDPAGNTIALRDAAAATVVGTIVKDAVYWVRWNGSTWIREETGRRRDLPLISPIAVSDVTGLQAGLDGKQPLDAELTALAGLTGAADRMPLFTGPGAATLATVTAAARTVLDDTTVAAMLATLGGVPLTRTEAIMLAVSDETTTLTAGTGKLTFRMPYAFTLSAVRASVRTAPTGATLIVDINEGGTTILSTKLSIDASERTSTTAASAAVISDTALADDAEITIDIDQIGSTIAGAGLKVTLIGTRP